MIRAIIIDDEVLARSLVKEYLQDFSGIELVAECNDGFEGVKAIAQHNPDLIFLDIQMPKISGFEMLELIDAPPGVIFTTAFDEFALKAFETHAVDYLLKPFSRKRFAQAIEKFLQQKNISQKKTLPLLLEEVSHSQMQSNRVVVKIGNKIKIIPVHEINYLEAADDYVTICTVEGSYLKNKTMGSFEKMLDGQLFIRTHRSFIVNVQQITRIEPNEKESYWAVLKDGKRIPVSKSGYARLRSILGL
jgi:two-component system, LytTR family, response regulator